MATDVVSSALTLLPVVVGAAASILGGTVPSWQIRAADAKDRLGRSQRVAEYFRSRLYTLHLFCDATVKRRRRRVSQPVTVPATIIVDQLGRRAVLAR